MATTVVSLTKVTQRRVSFQGIDSDEENKRSFLGHSRRRERKELKKLQKLLDDLTEDDEAGKFTPEQKQSIMKHALSQLNRESNHDRILGICTNGSDFVSRHKGVTEEAVSDCEVHLYNLLRVAGSPECDSLGVKLSWFRTTNFTLESLADRMFAHNSLWFFCRNICFRTEFSFASEPTPSSSEEVQEALKASSDSDIDKQNVESPVRTERPEEGDIAAAVEVAMEPSSSKKKKRNEEQSDIEAAADSAMEALSTKRQKTNGESVELS